MKDIVEALVAAQTRVDIVKSALLIAAEFPSAFRLLEEGMKAIRELRPGWPTPDKE